MYYDLSILDDIIDLYCCAELKWWYSCNNNGNLLMKQPFLVYNKGAEPSITKMSINSMSDQLRRFRILSPSYKDITETMFMTKMSCSFIDAYIKNGELYIDRNNEWVCKQLINFMKRNGPDGYEYGNRDGEEDDSLMRSLILVKATIIKGRS